MRLALLLENPFVSELDAQTFEALARCWPDADQVASPAAAGFGEYDAVISIAAQASQPISTSLGTPHICYVGPLPPQSHALASENPPCGATAFRRLKQPYARIESLPPISIRSSQRGRAVKDILVDGVTHFVASSRGIQERISRRTGAVAPVIYPPVNTALYRPGLFRRRPYYFLVHREGSASGYELAAEACRLMRRELVIAGPLPEKATRLLRAMPHVCCAGRLPVELLLEHFRSCRALLFAGVSDFEPAIVAAQACGTPVVAYRQGGALETVIDAESSGSGTGFFFHEPSAHSLADALRELERRPHYCEPALAWANAARFSTSRFEAEMQSFVGRVLSSIPRDGKARAAGENASHIVPRRKSAA